MTNRIFWNNEEWRDLAAYLIRTYPGRAPEALTWTQIKDAMESVLPSARYRPMPVNGSPTKFHPKLRRAYQQHFPTLIPGAPSTSPDDQRKTQRPHIYWTESEFLLLARELYRISPHEGYLTSKTLAGLRPKDVQAAERVLPAHRRRNLATVFSLRKNLLIAFAKIKQEEDDLNDLLAVDAKRKDFADHPEKYGRAPKPASDNGVEPPNINPYEAILKPLIDMVATEVMRRMVETYRPAAPRPAAAPMAPTQPHQEVFKEAGRVKIAIMGPLPIQANELAQEFPQLDILAMESSSSAKYAVSVFRSATKVIGMTNFMNHSMDGALKRAFGEKYVRVTGGVSAIKRQINLMMTSGAIQ